MIDALWKIVLVVGYTAFVLVPVLMFLIPITLFVISPLFLVMAVVGYWDEVHAGKAQ